MTSSKSGGQLRADGPPGVAYRCMHEHRNQYALTELAGLVGVSRSACYRWAKPEVSLRRKPRDAEFSGGRASGSSSGRAARGCGRNCAGSAYNKGPPCCGNRACTTGGGEFLPVVLDLYDRKIIRGTSRPSTPRPPPTARPYRLYTSSSPDQGKQVR